MTNDVDLSRRLVEHEEELERQKVAVKLEPHHSPDRVAAQAAAHNAVAVRIEELLKTLEIDQRELERLRKPVSRPRPAP